MAALDWYRARNTAAADHFLALLDTVVDSILERPRAWPEDGHGSRRRVLSGFPFVVVYRYDEAAHGVLVLAIAHTSREPGFWRDRG